jgi:mono/diheme cytochrome c family protein
MISKRRLRPQLPRGDGLFNLTMTFSNRNWFVLSTLLVLALAGCGLSSEPEIVQEIALPSPVPQVASPVSAPDLAQGAVFYAEHCAMCHGPAGQGDGEMVLDGRLQNPPPDFTLLSTASAQTPLDYMQAITDGNMLAGMPPFSRYTDAERWNVTAYVYLAAFDSTVIAQGAAVYETACASCHGLEGRGDGPNAAEIMPDLTALDDWSTVSHEALYATISNGMRGMPAFGDQLSESDRWAVVGYLHSMAVNGMPGMGEGDGVVEMAAAEPEAAAAEVTATPAAVAQADDDNADAADVVDVPEAITISGQVTNGTVGGSVPEGLSIMLHMFDTPEFTETTLEAVIGPDGAYQFDDVPHLESRVYLLSVQYEDVFFSSTVYTLEDSTTPALDTGVEIFDTTDDVSALTITAGVMRITFTNFGMEVGEVLSIENTSDRLFLTDEFAEIDGEISESQRVALRFPLPPGAGGVGFEPGTQGTRFQMSEDGTTVLDLQPVRPGTKDIFFSYFIPYEDGAIIEQEVLYPLDGPFHLLIEAGQVALESPLFTEAGERVDMGGQPFEAYQADLTLEPGDTITYTITGLPDAVAAARGVPAGTADTGGLSPLVLGLLIAGVLFIGVGGFLFLMRQGVVDEDDQAIQDLLDQIAELDDQHDAGMLNHDYYQRMRAKLKSELAALMQQRSQPEDDA